MSHELLKAELGRIADKHRLYLFWKRLAFAWGFLVLLGTASTVAGIAGPGLLLPRWALIAAGLISVLLACFLGRRRLDMRSVATLIEQGDPRLRTLLLAAVDQLEEAGPEGPSFLSERVILKALEANRRHSWSARVSERLFFVQCASLALFFLFIGLMLASGLIPSPKQRSLFALPSSSQLEISPGDTAVERGHGLIILAKFGGTVPLAASLVLTKPSGSETIPLVKSLADPVFAASLTEVTNDFVYRVAYKGKNTRDYKVTVFDYPALLRSDAELTFPSYTTLPRQKIDDTRHISAVEGTELTLALAFNKKVASARLIGRNRTTLPLVIDKQHPTASLPSFLLQSSNTFSLELVDFEGRTNKTPAQFVMHVLKNQRPELKLAQPRGDTRVSPLEEFQFGGQVWDDFGIISYGIGYALAGSEAQKVRLGGEVPRHEKRPFNHQLSLEALSAQPDQLVSFYLWGEDIGPDGAKRETVSDIYFAEVRHFEEIFREGAGSGGEGEAPQGGEQTANLVEIQKQVISATWKLGGSQAQNKTRRYDQDLRVVEDSQKHALTLVQNLKKRLADPRLKPALDTAEKEMESAVKHLAAAAKGPELIPPALRSEENAYQALLKLQAREFAVSQSRSRGQGGQQRGDQRRELEQLELTKSEDRYEKQRKPSMAQTPQQQEDLEALKRLKELAERQQDLNEKLKEIDSAMAAAKTPEQKAELRRQLARLRDQEQEVLRDLDELRQRMDQPGSSSQLAENRQQVDQTRNEVRQAGEAMDKGNVSQALTAGTRAERNLEEIKEKFRKQNANQFADSMKEMRGEARELAQKQTEIGRAIQSSLEDNRKTLRDASDKQELLTQLGAQKDKMTNLFDRMSQVIEASENAEPLLSRQLYDTLRKANQGSLDKGLDFTGELLKRRMPQQAMQFEERVETGFTELKQGIERAADNILGDEVEALRMASQELEDLAKQVEKEAPAQERSSTTSTNSSLARGPANGDQAEINQGQAGQEGSADSRQTRDPGQAKETLASATQGGRGTGRPSPEGGRSPAEASRLRDNNSKRTQGGSESQAPGSAPSERNSEMRRRYGLGQGGRYGPGGPPRPGAERADNPGNSSEGRQGRPEPGQRSRARTGMADGRGTGGGGEEFGGLWGGSGPITGSEYRDWADRLGNVEEMLDYPDLRNELNRIRERARNFRTEFKDAGTKPDWVQVRLQIVEPLAEVRNRVQEELLRRQSPDALAPIDRDPVPNKFTDLVRRYYENLGKTQ